MNDSLPEDLLHAWMQMSVFIRGNRILDSLSFNEIMICGLLFRQPEGTLTATDLGTRTKLLKSQVNHILADLEKRELITRARSTADKRVVHLSLTPAGRALYLAEHGRVLEIVGTVRQTLGDEKTKELTALMTRATAIVNKTISAL